MSKRVHNKKRRNIRVQDKSHPTKVRAKQSVKPVPGTTLNAANALLDHVHAMRYTEERKDGLMKSLTRRGFAIVN